MYYLKWQKQINNHLFSLTTFGAPQEHGQRKYQTGASIFDKNFATQLGIDTSGLEGNYGLNYNPNWGNYNNYQVFFDENNNPSSFTLNTNQSGIPIVQRVNDNWGWLNRFNYPGYGRMVTRAIRGTSLDTFERW